MSENNQQSEASRALQSVVSHAKHVGLDRFVLAFTSGPLATVQFQDIPPSEAVMLGQAIIKNAVRLELDHHPEYSKEYIKAWESVSDDLDKVMTAAKKRFGKFSK